MARWVSRYLSLDDLWSVAGYVLLLAVSRLSTPPVELAAVSVLASGMLAILWLANGNVRSRNLERNPNARVLLWALVAVASVLVAIR